MPQAGTLKVWKEERGFGFIAPADGSAEVFLHVSAFPREGPRPVVGETLLFEIGTGKDGKPRAARVLRPGQLRTPPETRRHTPRSPASRPPGRSPWGSLMGFLLLGALVAAGYSQYRSWQAARPMVLPLDPPTPAVSAPGVAAPRFQCDGRTQCAEMTSCPEARYFLKNCPGVQMDGDGDGTPCERQWCN